MKNTIICILIIFANMLCVHAASNKTKIEEKIAKESPTHEQGELAFKGAQNFSEIPGITESQRLSLLKINMETADKAKLIQTEILQTKMVLFKTLSNPNYKRSDIDALKNKIVHLDRKRLDLMFESLDRVEKVIKHNQIDKESLFKDLFLKTPDYP